MQEMTLFKTMFLLTMVMDPIGNVATFLSLLQAHEVPRQKRIILREMSIALVAMLGLLWFGPALLRLLGLQQSTLQITGGLLLFLIAIRMVFPGVGLEPSRSNHVVDDPLIVPLAIPLVVGPSVTTTIILLSGRASPHPGQSTLAVLGAWLACTVVLYNSSRLSRLFGPKGLEALQRLMGMLLSALAIQMFIRGLHEAFPGVAAGVQP